MLSFEFLSTPSVWRATFRRAARDCPCFISIHALRVEGDVFRLFLVIHPAISIHALRVEGDPQWHFPRQLGPISIHALRVEGDKV